MDLPGRIRPDSRDFFILLKGRVLLSYGKKGSRVLMARYSGESNGWSTLMGRVSFSGSATCQDPTSLLNSERDGDLGK